MLRRSSTKTSASLSGMSVGRTRFAAVSSLMLFPFCYFISLIPIDPPALEALFPEHSGSYLRRWQQRSVCFDISCFSLKVGETFWVQWPRGWGSWRTSTHAERRWTEGSRSSGVCQQAGSTKSAIYYLWNHWNVVVAFVFPQKNHVSLLSASIFLCF